MKNTLAKTIGGAALSLALFGGMTAVAAAQEMYTNAPAPYPNPYGTPNAPVNTGGTGSAAGTGNTTGAVGTGAGAGVTTPGVPNTGSTAATGTSTGTTGTTKPTTGTKSTTPGVPNTGAGGDAATNLALLGVSALIAIGGAGFLARRLAY